MSRDQMPKIGCIGHDCRECKRRKRAESAKRTEAIAFVAGVYKIMRWLDTEFANAPRSEQTKRIADNTSAIELHADTFAHFGLGLSFTEIGKLKGKPSKVAK